MRVLSTVLPADVRAPPLLKASVVWPSKRFSLALSESASAGGNGGGGGGGGSQAPSAGVATNMIVVSGRPSARPQPAARTTNGAAPSASSSAAAVASLASDELPDPRPLPPPLTSQLFLTATFSMLTSLSRTSPPVHAQVLDVPQTRLHSLVTHPLNTRQELQSDVARLIAHLRATSPQARGAV